MPKSVAALTALQVRRLKPDDKPLRDGGGLYLLPRPAGRHAWRLDYRFHGVRKTIGLGLFPDVGLAEARQQRQEARRLLALGQDPSEARRQERARHAAAHAAQRAAVLYTFERLALDWEGRQRVATATAEKNRWMLSTYLLPLLGAWGAQDLARSPRAVLDALRVIEQTGKLETARRARAKLGQIFRFGMIEGAIDADPTAILRGALPAPAVRHHPAVTDPADIGRLMRAIEGFTGQPATRAALRLSPLVFVRPGELRRAEWSEVDLSPTAPTWRIPGARMKMKAAHLVPLSRQAAGILRELQRLTGGGRYVFPCVRTASRPLSENTVTAALRRLGYAGDEMTAHGFRSMAATRLNEMGWRSDAIERQLAHAESNKVREAYTHAAQYLDERRAMMQAWADELDALRERAGRAPDALVQHTGVRVSAIRSRSAGADNRA